MPIEALRLIPSSYRTSLDASTSRPAVRRVLSIAIALCATLIASVGWAQDATPDSDGQARCEALRTMDFSRIHDAPVEVQSVSIEALHADQPEVCQDPANWVRVRGLRL